MKKLTTKTAAVLLFVVAIMMVVVSLPVDEACAARRIIRESSVSSDYQPGQGTPIGKISRVYGKVFVMHQDMGAIYAAGNDFALYAGDTITTKSNGRITFIMKDDSVMTLAPNTTMVLNEAVFDPAVKRRSSLLSLISGKARFYVKKFADFQNSTFRVKTKTSIAAVRGSDFVIEITDDDEVRITCGDNTVVWVYPVDPATGSPGAPITVSSFQQLALKLGDLTGQAVDITSDVWTNLVNALGGGGDGGGGDGGGQEGDGYGGTFFGNQSGGGSNPDTVSPSDPD